GSVTSNVAHLTVNAAGPGGTATTVVLQQTPGGYAGTMDTYIDQYDTAVPQTVWGNVNRLEVRWFTGAATEHMVTLLRFDLSSIPTTATVTSAQLTLYITPPNNSTAGDVLAMEKVTSNWNDSWTWSMVEPTGAPSGV